MIFTFVDPPPMVVPHERRMEHNFRKNGFVSIAIDARRMVTVKQRTEALPRAWSANTLASTNSGFLEPAAALSVTVSPGKKTFPLGEDDRISFMLTAIKRITGWSWERVSEALRCSRQAVHGWTLGKEISAPNFERLAKLYATLSFTDCGVAERNRALLQTVAPDGSIVADLLNSERFEDVRSLLGRGSARQDEAVRLRVGNIARQDDSAPHWFERIAETRGEEMPLEFVKSGERRRMVLRPKG